MLKSLTNLIQHILSLNLADQCSPFENENDAWQKHQKSYRAARFDAISVKEGKQDTVESRLASASESRGLTIKSHIAQPVFTRLA